ncbi:MAG TPA: SpoIIE family protein phosphatase [Verrucomicrobiae bacterium]|nr:SpoIIE family protein phosphatase [Verrucomicrobiae bacterium]
MHLGIRTKFIGILVVAAVVPFAIAIVTIWVLGDHYYRRDKGALFQDSATHLAESLDMTLGKEIEELSDWLLLSDLTSRIKDINRHLPDLTREQFLAHIQDVEACWPTLDRASPELERILTNDISRQLKAFQSVCPLFAEILVTDIKGQLVGATGKTSDYWQADEDWWQQTLPLAASQAHLEGINFDESAAVYSVDVAVPVRNVARLKEPAVGVLKGVLNASPLFASAQPIPSSEHGVQRVVLGDGRILADLSGGHIVPMKDRISPSLLPDLLQNQPGWAFAKVDNGPLKLVGYAPIRPTSRLIGETISTGLKPLYVIVYDDASAVLAPVRRQLRVLCAASGLVILGFTLTGLYITNRRIIEPIQRLRTAAQRVASSAKLTESEPVHPTTASMDDSIASAAALEEVRQIRTSDEIQSLAQDFLAMAVRVLRYHEQLEEEIQHKTAQIQRDLRFAREFQEALMPRSYPRVPTEPRDASLALNFHHVYRPTSSVGGDFFDVLKLDDLRAGIFIADVMGHGARSALVTAILRTLLHDLSRWADDPAQLLGLLNRRFCEILQPSKQVIFASAFYLIIDTQKGLAMYASAGHPSPLLVERSRRNVRPLIHRLENNPALGLISDAQYTRFASFVGADDAFLLYTDGIVEAANAVGEEFGRERLVQVLSQQIEHPVAELTQSVIGAVNRFTGSATLPDDICLVAVDVSASTRVAPSEPPTEAARA